MTIAPKKFRLNEASTYEGRRNESAHRKLYTRKWSKARGMFLSMNPFCVTCMAEGFDVAATVVDHIIPHRGNEILFWNPENWQALCDHHHNIKTAQGL